MRSRNPLAAKSEPPIPTGRRQPEPSSPHDAPTSEPPKSPLTPPRVFLSFASEHKPLVDRFRGQAAACPSGPWFRDCSLEQPVVEWKKHAERLIRSSAATICLVGDTTWRSEPVNWEIRRSVKLGKPVLAVSLQPGDVPIPPALVDLGVRPVPFNPTSLALSLRS